MSNEQVSLCAFVIAFYTNLFLKWMQFKYDKELPTVSVYINAMECTLNIKKTINM